MSILNNDNFDEYAVSNYINPNCVSVLEFLDDLKIIKYIKRLINKYVDKDELKERLILKGNAARTPMPIWKNKTPRLSGCGMCCNQSPTTLVVIIAKKPLLLPVPH